MNYMRVCINQLSRMSVILVDEVYYDYDSGYLILNQPPADWRTHFKWKVEMDYGTAKQILDELCQFGYYNLSGFNAEFGN